MISASSCGSTSRTTWSVSPTTFTPSTFYQHTPSGELITVDWVSVGRYEVALPASMSQFGNAQAVAYGGNHTALIDAWFNSGGKMKVFVSTVDPAGNLVDGNFCVHYREGGADDERAAYLWANQASDPSYTPATNYSWNGNRADPTITRISDGVYDVILPTVPLGRATARRSTGSAMVSTTSSCRTWLLSKAPTRW